MTLVTSLKIQRPTFQLVKRGRELFLNGGTAGGGNNQDITAVGGMFSSNQAGQLSCSMLDVLTVKNAKKMLTAVDGALVRSILKDQILVRLCLVWNTLLTTYQTLLKTLKKHDHVFKILILLQRQQIHTKAQVLNHDSGNVGSSQQNFSSILLYLQT